MCDTVGSHILDYIPHKPTMGVFHTIFHRRDRNISKLSCMVVIETVVKGAE